MKPYKKETGIVVSDKKVDMVTLVKIRDEIYRDFSDFRRRMDNIEWKYSKKIDALIEVLEKLSHRGNITDLEEMLVKKVVRG